MVGSFELPVFVFGVTCVATRGFFSKMQRSSEECGNWTTLEVRNVDVELVELTQLMRDYGQFKF